MSKRRQTEIMGD